MDRSRRRKVAAGSVAALAVAGGGGAIAATQFNSPKQESQAIVNDAAGRLGVQPNALSSALKKALEDRVDAAVAAGRITKAQGAELKQRIEAGDVPLFAGPHGGRGDFGHHGFPHLGAAASYLGLTQAQLGAKLESGKTLAQVAKAQSKSVGGLVDALVADEKTELAAAVSAGRITQAQADQFLQDAKQRFTDMVNGRRPNHGPGDRPFDGGGAPNGGPDPGGASF